MIQDSSESEVGERTLKPLHLRIRLVTPVGREWLVLLAILHVRHATQCEVDFVVHFGRRRRRFSRGGHRSFKQFAESTILREVEHDIVEFHLVERNLQRL